MSKNQTDSKYEKAIKLTILCLIWYVVSSVMGVVGKMILKDFPYPITLTMVQLVSVIVYLVPFMKTIVENPPFLPFNLAKIFWFQMLFPLALGKFLSSAFSHISIWKVPVSYVHTVKATLPLFTVVISRVLLREQQTYKIYISLIPIICGVVIASMTEISFDFFGLLSALLSTVVFALQNIYSKKCLKEHPLHHFTLLFTLAAIAAILFLPLWIYWDLRALCTDLVLNKRHNLPRLFSLLLVDGICYFSQNVIAFTIIAMVSPLSYAVANCTKRIAIISVSLLILGNPVTFYNAVGMGIAILGVLCYKKAKYDQYFEVEQTLPTYNDMNDSLNNNILLKQHHKHSNGIHRNDSYGNGMVVVPGDHGHLDLDTIVNRYHNDHLTVVNLRNTKNIINI